MKVEFEKLSPAAKYPTYATEGSAAFDIYSPHDYGEVLDTVEVATGLMVAVPVDHVMLIFSRSGHAFNYHVRMANCVAVIDSDFRGEIKIKLKADGLAWPRLIVRAGDRIAQGIIIPRPKIEFVEVAVLSATSRGDGGFGSTGA